jgi:hypothetical protein
VSESWLEIGDPDLDAQEIERKIEARIAQRERGGPLVASDNVELALGRHVADSSDQATLSDEAACDRVSRWLEDCEVVPANYVIDWRVPIIGPIHAAIRRVIHAENRRSLFPALGKQSHLNRAVLEALVELCQENARLCRDLEQVRRELAQLRTGQEREIEGGAHVDG